MLLSIVIPARNEVASLPVLLGRCRAVGDAIGEPFEILLVDDASTDGTAEWLAERPELPVRRIHHPVAWGHLSSVRHGLALASGSWVCVIDGDLQDPPEVMASLLGQARQSPHPDAVFAVKSARQDPPLFLVAQWIFHRLQHTFARTSIPLGASTCCILSRDLARRVAALPLEFGNVASIVAALGAETDSVPYERGARHGGGVSRLGWRGHVQQAFFALALTGALGRIAVACLAVLAVLVVGSLLLPLPGALFVPVVFGASALGACGFGACLAVESRLRRMVAAPLRADAAS